MVKHSAPLMSRFFTRERFGRPQFVAGALLVVFLAQGLWLLRVRAHGDAIELGRIEEGLGQWKGEQIAGTPSTAGASLEFQNSQVGGRNRFDTQRSPLWYLIASFPFLIASGGLAGTSGFYPDCVASLPFLAFGALLGASVWYVARRLYGNAGGYIALVLYCFSPGILRASTMWHAEPESGAAWGAFGAVFTAIAVAHTLYAPREVVLWNWRRIGLLGLSFALAVGSQFSLIVLLPVALLFMLYVVPERRGAALAIWAAAFVVGFILLLAAYFFHAGAMWQSIKHADFFSIEWRALTMPSAFRQAAIRVAQSSIALTLALPAALVTFAVWRRARYFGNMAPLLVGLLLMLLAVVTPHHSGQGFTLMALPFLLVFVAGVLADLLETRQRLIVLACIWALLASNAMLNLLQLARLG
jgi:hypothetical protein